LLHELQKDDVLFFATEKEAKDDVSIDLSAKEDLDITPSVNILVRGGDVYDFPNAIAEIIDNAIQVELLRYLST